MVSETQKLMLNLTVSEEGCTKEEIRKVSEDFKAKAKKCDIRALVPAFVYTVADIGKLQAAFAEKGVPVQAHPNEIYVEELYGVDPLGNVVGFTHAVEDKNNGFSSYGRLLTPPSLNEMQAKGNEQTIASGETNRNIAVMTSGGDAPGMNAVIYSVVRAAIFRKSKAFAILEGYRGLVNGGEEYIREMQWTDVRNYLSEGGTNIGTARCKEFTQREGRLAACKNLITAGVNALIVCGGDGSLTGADLFRSEWPSLIGELRQKNEVTEDEFHKFRHLSICGLVGSIDNDMAMTDSTIGAYSSLERICRAVDYIDATAKSHSRAFVIEVMGRHCGWLALMAGIATAADYIFIPERPVLAECWKKEMCQIVSRHRELGKRKSIVIVAEGAIASDLKPVSSDYVKDVLVDQLHLDTKVTILGHVQRGGTAVAFDRMLAAVQGVEAVKCVLEGNPETPSQMIGIIKNKIVRKPLMEAVKVTKQVAECVQKKEFEKAISLRDSGFHEYLKNYITMNSAASESSTLPATKSKRIAIINVGAPAGGMNSAIYSMATYCMARGHKPYSIHNGFTGLARHESIRLIKWLDAEEFNSSGGSDIGTNRITPCEAGLGMIAYYFEKYQFDGLILVGGFEALTSLSQLEKARIMYPAFRIPMVLIPATISNNVPGTDYSLGADTCLNSLMEYCDVIKQSASSTKHRVFIIEVQGGNSGYIATFASMVSGALITYVPEEGISLTQLQEDINFLKETFSREEGIEKSGKLILKSANASKVLTNDVLGKIFREETDANFDFKHAVPGHIQQGGLPSPIDRTRASQFAISAVKFIEEKSDLLAEKRYDIDLNANDPEIEATAAVLGVRSSELTFTPVRPLYHNETHVGRRTHKHITWSAVKEIADELVGREGAN